MAAHPQVRARPVRVFFFRNAMRSPLEKSATGCVHCESPSAPIGDPVLEANRIETTNTKDSDRIDGHDAIGTPAVSDDLFVVR